MASGLVDVEAGRLLDLSLTGSSATAAPTTPWKLALSTATTSGSSAGTEVVGGSYARATITWVGAGTLVIGSTSNAATINFTNMPAATVTDINIYDSAGTPRRLWWGALTASKAVAVGDTLSFAGGAVAITLA